MRRRKKTAGQDKRGKSDSGGKKFRRAAASRQAHDREHLHYLEEEVIGFLHAKSSEQNMAEIMNGLSLSRSDRKLLSTMLADLCRRDILSCSAGEKKGRAYGILQNANLVEGTVEVNPRGFGFAIIGERPSATKKSDKARREDPFIAPDNLGSAHQGDRALFRLYPKKGGRAEARVIKVIKRAAEVLVGIYEAGRQTSRVIPEDERFLFTVLVNKKNSCGARNGEAVLVEVTDYKAGNRNPEGRIIEVLGNPDDIAVQTEIVIRKHRLPHKFSDRALVEAESYPDTVPAEKGRQDLRHIPHVTIDGETARDFDDAVAVEKIPRGWRLYVSIADVGYYVKPGSVLDREAYQRGTSVYFPSRVVPMLPERLSNNLCSLVPNEPRPAFTAIMEFDRQGRRLAKKFARSIIVSRHRLTYTKVKRILVDRDSGLAREYSGILAQLEEMADLAAVLESMRLARGSIGFSLPEAEVLIDETGEKITDVIRAERNMAHKLIEEFMLAANEAVAATLAAENIPTLYRIHEEPDNIKVMEFTAFAKTLGLHLPTGTSSPRWFGKILAMVAGTPKEYIVNNILLRTMQRARYSHENVGHFGLAATHYTHFTSPIRRYPDLVVHRVLADLLANKKKSPAPAMKLPEAGEFLSGRERAAVDAERELAERLQIKFMAGKVGESFEGIISGVTAFGLFVELLDHFVSGAIEIARLKGDYFQFDERNYRLVGSRTNRIFQVGDLVSVTVQSVDARQRRISFVLV